MEWTVIVAGVVTALLLYPVWVVVHEGAHALVVIGHGGKVKAFRPWPHRRNGEWVFGWISYYFDGPEDHYRVWVAAYRVDAIEFSGLYTVAWMLGGPVSVGGMVATVALFAPAVNTAVGVLGRYRKVNPLVDLARVQWKDATVFLFLLLAYGVLVGLLFGRVVAGHG
jgi:uncharacterized membrane protein